MGRWATQHIETTGIRPTESLVRTQALYFAQTLGWPAERFKASSAWVSKCVSRLGMAPCFARS